MNLRHERAQAVAAVEQAARLCRSVREAFAPGALTKLDRTPVSVADFGSQALICAALSEAFPDDPILAEEESEQLRRPESAAILNDVVQQVRAQRPGADSETILDWIDRGSPRSLARRFWTLDPIDGTKGFLRGGQYAVALALIWDGEVVLAALACPHFSAGPEDPARGRLFVAERGRGTTVRDLGADPKAVLTRVSRRSPGEAIRVCERLEAGPVAHQAAAVLAERLGGAAPFQVDSQAKYALVASGDAELYVRFPRRADERWKIWDHAAGALVASEAGARVTDLAGRPLDFRHGGELTANDGLLVSNGRIHDQALALAVELRPPLG